MLIIGVLKVTRLFIRMLALLPILVLTSLYCLAGDNDLVPGDSIGWEFKVTSQNAQNDSIQFELTSNGGTSFDYFDITLGKVYAQKRLLNDGDGNRIVFWVSEDGLYQLVFHYKDSLLDYPDGAQFSPTLKLIDNSPSLDGKIVSTDELAISKGTSLLEDQFITMHSPPMNPFLKWGGIIAVLILIFILVIFILKRDNMPLGKKTFKGGNLMISDQDNNQILINLDTPQYKYGFTLNDISGAEFSPGGSGLSFAPTDKTCRYTRKQKRFCSFKYDMNEFSGTVKNDYIPDLEPVHISGEVLYNHDTVQLIQGVNSLVLRYSNSNLNRQ